MLAQPVAKSPRERRIAVKLHPARGQFLGHAGIAHPDRGHAAQGRGDEKVDLAAGTLNGFAFHDGVTGAPVLDIAVAWGDCEVRQQIELGGHTLFVGEVVDAGFREGVDEDTPVLSMGDTRMNYGG